MLKGQKHSKETREKISKANKGRKCTKEAREKISKASKGKPKPKPEGFGKKISQILTGRIKDPEERKRLYGRVKSKAEREKISKALSGRKGKTKKRNYDPRLALAKELFIENITPKHISFKEDEREYLATQAKLVYKQWTYQVKSKERTAEKRIQRQQFKQWLIEQCLWRDGRSTHYQNRHDYFNKLKGINK